MEFFDQIWDYFTKLPQLLDQYSTYSNPLLAVLLAGGILIVGAYLFRKWRGQEGLSVPYAVFGTALVFLSASGLLLKWVGIQQLARVQANFIATHRAPAGEQWLLVFDFSLPPTVDAQERKRLLNRMELLVAAMSEVLLEDLPRDFRPPRVIRVPTSESPWQGGIDQRNFEDILRELNAFEIVWGNVHEQGTSAKAFLGISRQLAGELDTVIPLRDFALDQDPRREHQFGDGYYRLLGLVTLGMALDTYQRAQQAQGQERKRLFLSAAEQLAKARELVANRRDDPILSRTVYAPQVNALMQGALQEAGLTP